MFPFPNPELMGNFFGPMLADDSIREGIESEIREWLSRRDILSITVEGDGFGQTFFADNIPRVVIAFAAATFGFSVPGYELPDIFQPR